MPKPGVDIMKVVQGKRENGRPRKLEAKPDDITNVTTKVTKATRDEFFAVCKTYKLSANDLLRKFVQTIVSRKTVPVEYLPDTLVAELEEEIARGEAARKMLAELKQRGS